MKKKAEMEQPSLHSNKDTLQVVLSFLLSNQIAFVLYKEPNADTYKIHVSNTIVEDEFVLQSFDSKSKTFIKGKTFFSSEISKIINLNFKDKVTYTFKANDCYPTQIEHEVYVQNIIQLCKQNKIEKCVAARKIKYKLPSSFSLANIFLKACKNYSKAFVHLSNSEFGLWFGATPELLLSNNGNVIQTVSLAGTKTDDRKWTTKEYEEQNIVTSYIVNSLNKVGVTNIKTSQVYTANAGHLKHLKTEISCDFNNINIALNTLHPTPAVCGTPKHLALNLILKKEKFNRTFYTGYIGKKGSNGFYYVNLRCMQIFEQHVDIYVGGGITKDSIPKEEWQETEEKSKVMKKLME